MAKPMHIVNFFIIISEPNSIFLRHQITFQFLISVQSNMKLFREDVFDRNWYFVSIIVQNFCEKKSSSDWVKLEKFEAEGQDTVGF